MVLVEPGSLSRDFHFFRLPEVVQMTYKHTEGAENHDIYNGSELIESRANRRQQASAAVARRTYGNMNAVAMSLRLEEDSHAILKKVCC